MKEIKKQVEKLPEAISSDTYQEGQLTAISLIIMKNALENLRGNLRDKVVKLAILLCDIDEEIIHPTD